MRCWWKPVSAATMKSNMEAPQSEAELPYNPANTLVGIYLRETKTNSKRVIKDLRAKTVKLLEENTGEKLRHWIW